MRRAAELVLSILYPQQCRLCGAGVAHGQRFFCERCMGELRPIGERSCTICCKPFEDGTGGGHPCWSCMKKPPPFDAARAPYVFEGAVREAVHLFKYGGLRAMSGYISAMFEGKLSGWFGGVTVCAAVPLHKNRLRSRGFNQSLLLARHAAATLCVPLSIDALVRTRDTRPQVDLPQRERAANVRGAFNVAGTAEFSGESVLLVDDVFTTGATVSECADVLKKSGARSVYVLTAARAI